MFSDKLSGKNHCHYSLINGDWGAGGSRTSQHLKEVNIMIGQDNYKQNDSFKHFDCKMA